MKLGFVGTGNISSDVVTGICNSKISYKQIILSPRNKIKSKKLNFSYPSNMESDMLKFYP